MPKLIDYPRASLKASILLAQSVDELGGSATAELVADKMGKKIGGAFRSLMAAAAKFGLVQTKKGRLTTTPLFRDYKLAYTKSEQEEVSQRAFLSVPLFHAVYERFKDQKLPVDHFEKLLIREFDVHEVIASRVGKYFVEGAKLIGLLNPDYTFRSGITATPQVDGDEELSVEPSEDSGKPIAGEKDGPAQPADSRAFAVRITGPGMDSVISILEPEDLLIVQAMLKKVERNLLERGSQSGEAQTTQ